MTTNTAHSVHDFTMTDIDGNEVPLSKYRGNVMLIVNVASKCGLTPQYNELQELHRNYADKGLRVVGFPANDFLGQEPGSNEQIKTFCTTKFGVEFDMFSKVTVKGKNKCDLYQFLTSKELQGDRGGELKWNFTKFLVDREGHVVARFEPKTKPDAPEVIAAIEEQLRSPA